MLNRLTVEEAKAQGLLGKGARFGTRGRIASGQVGSAREQWGVANKADRPLIGIVVASKREMLACADLQQLVRLGESGSWGARCASRS